MGDPYEVAGSRLWIGSAGHCGHFGDEPEEARSFSLCPFFSFCKSAFQEDASIFVITENKLIFSLVFLYFI